MDLTFYYSPMSTAIITNLVLEELNLPCKKINVDLRAGDTKKPDFIKLNPNAKVPLIVHDGVAIWESAAITMYLGETFGVDKKLYPASGTKRGEAMKWVTWSNVTLAEAVGRWARNTMSWVPAEQHNAKTAEVAMTDIKRCLEILDQELSSKPFLLGDYTLVDTHCHSITDWMKMMEIDFSSYKNVNAWSQSCSSRPTYTKAMAAK